MPWADVERKLVRAWQMVEVAETVTLARQWAQSGAVRPTGGMRGTGGTRFTAPRRTGKTARDWLNTVGGGGAGSVGTGGAGGAGGTGNGNNGEEAGSV
jgi:hypothetical protein